MGINFLDLSACRFNNGCMQYTLRNIPKAVDRALRKKAKAEGKSLNEAAIEALRAGIEAQGSRVKRRDLSDLAGTWVEDPEFDKAIAEQDQVDPEAWT